MAEIFFPEKMDRTEGLDDKEVLKIHDDYIRYIVERIDFAFNGYTNRKKFIKAVEDVVEDGELSKELTNEKEAREQAVIRLNEKLDRAGGLHTTTIDGIVYMHDKETLGDSTIVIKVTNEAIAVSNDGGATYNWGVSLDDGEAIMKTVYAAGIDADHIRAGRITDSAGNFYLDLETGELDISGGRLNIQTSNKDDDIIALAGGGFRTSFYPRGVDSHYSIAGVTDQRAWIGPDGFHLIASGAYLDATGVMDLKAGGLEFMDAAGQVKASYPAQPLSWQNFTPAAGTASPFQIAKYLNVVELYGGLTGLSSATSVNLGTLPYKPRNSWSIIPTYQTAAPYLQNGTIWIDNTGAMTLYKSSASTGCYFNGTFVCQ